MAVLRPLQVFTALVLVTLVRAIPGSEYLRLVGGSKPSEGRLEVRLDEDWGTVCDKKLSRKDAKTICREMGFPAHVAAVRGDAFGQGTGKILMSHIGCNGTEASVFNCSYKSEGEFQCGHERDASIICMPMEPKARLVEGPYDGAGRLELSYDNGDSWGTVCNESWSWRDTLVACAHLGYDATSRAVLEVGSFEPGDEGQPIFISKVGCSRDCSCSSNLLQCSHQWEGIECSHAQDVGLACVEAPDE